MLNFARIHSAFAFTALLTIASAAVAGGPKNSKVSKDLVAQNANATVPVIIQYTVDPSDSDVALLQGLNGQVRHALHSIHAVHALLPVATLDALTKNPNVSYVSLDRPLSAKQISTTSAEYTAEPVNAPAVWAKGLVGTNIGVAVIDSGINTVPDLTVYGASNISRVVYNQSFVPSDLTDAGDYFGHGTHVAGLIAGNGESSTGKQYFRTFYGTAPNANLINLRVLDQNGQGTDSSVIAAIEQAIALKTKYNIKVINLSVGRPVYESFTQDPLCLAVEQAWHAGIVVVVAAGNDGRDQALNPEGYGTIEAPGNDPYVLTVGAVKSMGTATIVDDQVASYSSKGPTFIDHLVKPDILAPGNVVTSLQFANDPLAGLNPSFVTPYSFYQTKGKATPSTDYFPLSGTSMSTGVVSGAVADLMQASPLLTPDQAKAFIMRSGNRTYLPATSVATDPSSGLQFTAHNDLFTVGAGYLDISAAVTSVLSSVKLPTGSAMSPIAAFDPTTNGVFLLEFPGSLWGTTSTYTAPPTPPAPPVPGALPVPPPPPAGPGGSIMTWMPADVYGVNAVGTQTTKAGAIWGWSPLYGATNTTGQPVAVAAGGTPLWGTTALPASTDPAAFNALWGNGTPLWGTGTPLWGTGTTDLGTGTPLWGTTTPLWGTSTPLWGTGTPLWGTGTPLWGTGTPLWGTGTPLWGTSTPEATNSLWGSSTTSSTSSGWGASTPQSTSTPLWGTTIPYEQ